MSIILFDGEVSETSEALGEVLPTVKVSHLFRSAYALQLICNVRVRRGTAPSLDVAVQAMIGDYWYNLARFSRYETQTGLKVITVKRDYVVTASVAPTGSPSVSTGELLQGQLWDDTLRVSYDLGGTSPIFVFSVTAVPLNW